MADSSTTMTRAAQNSLLAGAAAPDDPDAVLKSFAGGNHEMALLIGEPEHKEAYVQKYGYEQALTVLDSVLKTQNSFFTKEGMEEIRAYKDDLLKRQQY